MKASQARKAIREAGSVQLSVRVGGDPFDQFRRIHISKSQALGLLTGIKPFAEVMAVVETGERPNMAGDPMIFTRVVLGQRDF